MQKRLIAIFGVLQLHCIAANRRSCRRLRSLTFMTARRIRVVSALHDRRVACVAAVEMILHYARFGGNAARRKRDDKCSNPTMIF